MNILKVKVKKILKKENLNLLECSFFGESVFLTTLDLPKTLKKDININIVIKSTNIALSKNFNMQTSFLNQLKSSIVSIEEGDILSVIRCALNGNILESVITTKALQRLSLHVGDSVIMFLPSNELSIYEILND